MSHRFHVITGGPGSGKSSLIEALSMKGYACMPEGGRAIIQDQVAIAGDALPWSNRQAFAEQMLGWELRSWRDAQSLVGPVFFDRGLPDVIGYLRLVQLPVPDSMLKAAASMRYADTVFLAPFWPKIFTQDAERKQDRDEAEATCDVMAEVYAELGYTMVSLPLASVATRVAFVMSRLDD